MAQDNQSAGPDLGDSEEVASAAEHLVCVGFSRNLLCEITAFKSAALVKDIHAIMAPSRSTGVK